MQCTLPHAPAARNIPLLPPIEDETIAYSLYEVRTPWKSSGYLITVPRDREYKFQEAMSLGGKMIFSRKLFETRDRLFALLMSANREF